MNLLFVYTNINGFHEDIYSFGLASIVSVARQAGHNAKVLVVRNRDEYSRVLREAAAFAPRLAGFTAVSSQFAFVRELAAAVKSQCPDVITVCGGVHPTKDPSCLLRPENSVPRGRGQDRIVGVARERRWQELIWEIPVPISFERPLGERDIHEQK